jgi:hypothetical protein
MEMAFVKAASCLIVAASLWAAEFPVRHDHLRKGCDGTMTVDEHGVKFAGPKGHAWTWPYGEIEELRLEPEQIRILTYKNHTYEFTGKVPADDLYRLWKDRLDQRFVAALVEPPPDDFAIPAKHLTRFGGSQGTLAFGDDSIVYSTESAGESRTWRFEDIDSISSSGPFQLTITTFERAQAHYGDRKGFNFALKEPLSESKYNEIWLTIERKNGRIQ